MQLNHDSLKLNFQAFYLILNLTFDYFKLLAS